jgi:hypothetical protein
MSNIEGSASYASIATRLLALEQERGGSSSPALVKLYKQTLFGAQSRQIILDPVTGILTIPTIYDTTLTSLHHSVFGYSGAITGGVDRAISLTGGGRSLCQHIFHDDDLTGGRFAEVSLTEALFGFGSTTLATTLTALASAEKSLTGAVFGGQLSSVLSAAGPGKGLADLIFGSFAGQYSDRSMHARIDALESRIQTAEADITSIVNGLQIELQGIHALLGSIQQRLAALESG